MARVAPVVGLAFLTLAALYAPQPLLPLFERALNLTETQAALLMSVALVPLAVAPLTFGAVLARQPVARVLRYGLAVLGLALLAFAGVRSLAALLILRFVQGVAIAAILTALMTYIATSDLRRHLRRVMSAYVAATIVGGFGGRLIAGALTAVAPWPTVFVLLGAALLLASVFAVRPMDGAPSPTPSTSPSRDYGTLLRDADYALAVTAIACLFFAFSALMNFLPFRLREVNPESSGLTMGLLYVGYLLGILTSMSAHRLAPRLGGETRTMVLCLTLTGGALLVARVPAQAALFATVFLVCAPMFLAHALAASRINRNATGRSGPANGLYVAFYYTGGVLGTFVPGPVYARFGWSALLLLLATVTAAGLLAALVLHHRSASA